MARKIDNAKVLEAMLKPGAKRGRYPAGEANLYLKIGRGDGQRSWTYFYRWRGSMAEHGLGSAFTIGLQAARTAARACRAQLDDGVKPGSEDGVEADASPLFGAVADAVVAAKSATWKGGTDGDSYHRWQHLLSRRMGEDGKQDGSGYCTKLIGRRVAEISEADVLGVLRPVRAEHERTCEILRAMIESVLHAGGRRGDNNPATSENLKHALAGQTTETVHYAAHPYADAPAFVAKLRASNEGVGAFCLEFLVLAWVRDRECREARWCEIERDNESGPLWRIPAHRMKKPREHLVPLTPRMLAILDEMAKLRPEGCDGSSFIFPGTKRGSPVSNKWLHNIMNRVGSTATLHGWRSCARTWTSEMTAHADGVAEAALSHHQRDRTAAAYNRGPLLEKRRKLMLDWSTFLAGERAAALGKLRRRRVILGRRPALALAA